MIPEWSGPSSTSSSARIMPSESSPRTLRRSSSSPFGSTAPGRATRDRRAGAEVPGAADDLPRLRLADVDAAELEPVGVRVLGRLHHPADEEAAEVAVGVGHAAALDPLDLRGRDREPRGELLERHVERDVVGEPGDRNAHQNCVRTRRSPSQSGLMSGMSYSSWATRSMPHPKANPGPGVRVDPDVREDARVDHPGAAHLDPAGVPAGAAAGAVADPARDVGLHRRLGEGEVVGAEPDPPVRAEDRPHHVQERALQVGERQSPVDGEALELVEDRVVRRVDCVAAVAAADRDHVDRRLPLLQRVDLGRRGLRAQQPLVVEEEGRPRRPGGVPLVERELVEVVLDRLDLAVVAHLVAQADERVLDLAAGLGDRVQVAERELVARERDVDGVLGQRPLEFGALERVTPLCDGGFQRVADAVQQRCPSPGRAPLGAPVPARSSGRGSERGPPPARRRSRRPRSRPAPRFRATSRPSSDCITGFCPVFSAVLAPTWPSESALPPCRVGAPGLLPTASIGVEMKRVCDRIAADA